MNCINPEAFTLKDIYWRTNYLSNFPNCFQNRVSRRLNSYNNSSAELLFVVQGNVLSLDQLGATPSHHMRQLDSYYSLFHYNSGETDWYIGCGIIGSGDFKVTFCQFRSEPTSTEPFGTGPEPAAENTMHLPHGRS
jgi:hypothetical protein